MEFHDYSYRKFKYGFSCTNECFSKAGETILGNSFQTVPGGKGANQAVAVARLGSEVAMVGCLGNDHFGETLHAAYSKSRFRQTPL